MYFTFHGFWHGHVDIGPLMGCLLLLPFIATAHMRPHCRRFRQVCVHTATLYVALRVWPWPGSALPTVEEGFPLPYSVAGPALILLFGAAIGLRVKHLLPNVAAAALAGILHLASVLENPRTVQWWASAALEGATLTGFAIHHLESLQRAQWMPQFDDQEKELILSTEVSPSFLQFKNIELEDTFFHSVLVPNKRMLLILILLAVGRGLLALFQEHIVYINVTRYVYIYGYNSITTRTFTVTTWTLTFAVLLLHNSVTSNKTQSKTVVKALWTLFWIIRSCTVFVLPYFSKMMNLNQAVCDLVGDAFPFFPKANMPHPATFTFAFTAFASGVLLGLRLRDCAMVLIFLFCCGQLYLFEAMGSWQFSRMNYMFMHTY